MRAAAASGLPALALALGCAVNPVSGRPEVVLVSQSQEQKIGDEAAKEVAEGIGFVDAPKASAYVSDLGQRLAGHSQRADIAYDFHIVDSAEPNAFALPGGHVYVSRGLLVFVNSEDELAGVMGHEIGHIAARHSVQRVTRAAPLGILTGVGSLVTGIVSPSLGRATASLGGLANQAALAPYSRGQETQADTVGQKIAAAAGFDPRGLSAFLHTLEREDALHEDRARRPAFLMSHPSVPERVEKTAARATELERGPSHPIAGSRAALLDRFEGLVIGEDPGQGVFEGELFLHPGMSLAIRFPEGWETANSRRAVGAIAPGDDALVMLEVASEGSDPVAVGRRVLDTAKLEAPGGVQPVAVAGLPGARAWTTSGGAGVALTWIAHESLVYQVVGLCDASAFSAWQETFDDTAGSFHTLSASERSRIEVTRVRVIHGRSGESLEALVARANGAATPAAVAVMNGVETGEPVRRGQLVKVPVRERY